MKSVKPKVYIIGSSHIDDSELNRFLDDIGAGSDSMGWANKEDGVSFLPELYGRMCYRSYTPGLNPNVTKIREESAEYLNNILSVGHESVLEHSTVNFIFHNVSRVLCFHPNTEILTKTGWKPIDKISDDETLLTLNPSTKKAEWQKNERLHVFDYAGVLYYFESSQIKSPSFTPDHIQWAAKYDLRKYRNKECTEILEHGAAKYPYTEIKDKRFVIQSSIQMDSTIDCSSLIIGNYTYDSKLFFKWLGLLITDGGIAKENNKCYITQSKPDVTETIRNLMTSLFQDRAKHSSNQYYVHDFALKKWLISTVGRLKKDRTLFNLFNYSKELLEELYQGILLGDGTIHQNHEVIYSGYKSLANDYQILCALLGKSSNIRHDESRVGQVRILNNRKIINKRAAYTVSIHKNGASLIKKSHQKMEQYTGKVYCPRTKNGLVYVRNRGISFWSGNTHELVRHRVGTALSQESLRYVRLNNLNYYIPQCILNNSALLSVFEETMEYLEKQQQKLAEIADIDNLTNFSEKKELTSAFRRIAPIGLTTTIGWSANIRTIRHVLELRTSKHAEEEIRVLFALVGKLMLEKFPHLFQDFEVRHDEETDIPIYSKKG